MTNKFWQWLSIKVAKRPAAVVLGAILLFNILFFGISVFIFKNFNLKGTEDYGFFESIYLTITMILDAGCISYVIEDIGKAGVATAVTCLIIIFIGMITFTGAVIGYITNWISSFIDRANSGYRRLRISNHTVILNWNSRASEIVNDLLYCKENQNVVILVSSGKERIEKELNERLSETTARIKAQRKEDKSVGKTCKVTFIVREGDIFSFKQLRDVSLEQAKMVIILGSDINNTVCKYEMRDRAENAENGNTLTVKTLMQVADITGADYSANNQRIIVEITDDWTDQLVTEVIHSKTVKGKCNIVPIRVNQVLGQLLSQFSITPELNSIYSELFSNQGATFFSVESEEKEAGEFINKYLQSHKCAIPLTVGKSNGKQYEYYSAASESAILQTDSVKQTSTKVSLNKDYWLEKRHVIILGHNSNTKYIMNGFRSFCGEWNKKDETILDIVIVDDEENIKKMGNYDEYNDFVTKVIPSDIYDRDKITSAINNFVSEHTEDTSILILSDDRALNDDIDANALANLIYVQDIINKKKEEDRNFKADSIDVIVELIDPRHHDIVNNYSGYNVVISNRYISKMITQIGEKDSLFEFYQDILSFDEKCVEGRSQYTSKEIYAKRVSSYFDGCPGKMTAAELIRAVYDESLAENGCNPAVVLGYTSSDGGVVLFEGDQEKTEVRLTNDDKIIVYSAH